MPTQLRQCDANQPARRRGRIGYCCVVMKLSITAPIYARACTAYHPAFSIRISMHVGQHRSTIRAARTNGQHAVWERRFAHHGRGCTRELVSRLASFTCFVPPFSVANLTANGLGMDPRLHYANAMPKWAAHSRAEYTLQDSCPRRPLASTAVAGAVRSWITLPSPPPT